jgi:hypothetical protein
VAGVTLTDFDKTSNWYWSESCPRTYRTDLTRRYNFSLIREARRSSPEQNQQSMRSPCSSHFTNYGHPHISFDANDLGRNAASFMGYEGSLQYSQQPVSGPYPEPDESRQHPPIPFL